MAVRPPRFRQRQMFKVSALSAALLAGYGSVHAQAVLQFHDGQVHERSFDPQVAYSLVDVSAGSQLQGQGLYINSTRGGQQGVLKLRGAAVELTQSRITVDARSGVSGSQARTYGVQVYADTLGALDSSLQADGLTIESLGSFGHAVQVYRRGDKDQTNADVVLTNSSITTSGSDGYGLQAVSDGQGTGRGTIRATGLTFSSSGAMGVGVFSDGSSARIFVADSSIRTTGENASAVLAKHGARVELDGVAITTSGRDTRHRGALPQDRDVDGAAIGVHDGSTVVVRGGSVEAQGADVWGVHAMTGSQVEMDGTTLRNLYEDYSSGGGVLAEDVGTRVQLREVDITVAARAPDTGSMPAGVKATHGARVELEGGSVTLEGGLAGTTGKRYARGLLAVEGTDTEGTRIAATGTDVTTYGHHAHAVHAYGSTDPARATPRIDLVGGTVSTFGNESYGLYAQNGGVIQSSADIRTSGQAGFAAFVYGRGSIHLHDSTLHTQGGVLAGRSIGSHAVLAKGANALVALERMEVRTEGAQAVGLLAEEGGTVTDEGSRVRTQGQAAHGVQALSGGEVRLKGSEIEVGEKATPQEDEAHHVQSHGLLASGAGSRIDGQQVQVHSHSVGTGPGDTPAGAIAQGGGVITLRGGSVAMHGERYTRGLQASGSGGAEGSAIEAEDVAVSTAGGNSHAVHTYGNNNTQSAKPRIDLVGGSVTTSGDESYGLFAQNNSQITVEDTAIRTSGKAGFGVYAYSGGQGVAEVKVQGGSIRTDGAPLSTAVGSHGVLAKSSGGRIHLEDTAVTILGDLAAGVVAEEGGSVTAVSTEVRTAGTLGFGVAAVNSASATLHDGSVRTAGVEAHGLSAALLGRIEASDWRITTSGKDAYGAQAVGSSELDLEQVDIQTSGAGAHGVVLGALSPQMRTAVMEQAIALTGANHARIQGGSVRTSGTDAAGVALLNSNTLEVQDVAVVAQGPALLSQFDKAQQTQSLDLQAGTDVQSQSGVLLRVERNDAGGDGVVKLHLQAGAFASGNIENYRDGVLADQDDALTEFTVDGYWAGIFRNRSTQVVEQGASVSYDAPIASDVMGAQDARIAFTAGAQVEGTVASGTNARVEFAGDARIGHNLSAQEGAKVAVRGNAQINASVIGVQSELEFAGSSTHIGKEFATTASTARFAGTATIAQGLKAANKSTVQFQGRTTIGTAGGNLKALSAAPTVLNVESDSRIQFSTQALTEVHGSVSLASGASTYGGTVATPIQVSGNMVLGKDAVLGGNWRVNGALEASEAKLVPGNSIGTQTYTTLGQITNTAYVAEINAQGQADRIVIEQGAADLRQIALQVRQEDGSGGYKLNHDYVIWETHSADGIGSVTNNAFSSASLDDSFKGALVKLDAVKYGDKQVSISLSLDQTASQSLQARLSNNRLAAYQGALSVMGANSAVDAALQATDPEAALAQLTGESHGTTTAAVQNASGMLVNVVGQRLGSNVGAGMLPGAPIADASGSLPASAWPRSAAYPLWVDMVGQWSTLAATDQSAESKTYAGGLFVGGDVPTAGRWRVGGALGLTQGRVRSNDAARSSSDFKAFTASAYAGHQWPTARGQLQWMFGGSYTRTAIESQRSVAIGGLQQQLRADYHVPAWQTFTELAYAIPVGRHSQWQPLLGWVWTQQRLPNFEERGGSAALRSQAQTDQVHTTTVGLRGNTQLHMGRSALRLSAQAAWRRAHGDVRSARTMSFVQGNGSAFTVAGAPIERNARMLGLAAELGILRDSVTGVSYQRQFGNGSTDHTATLYWKLRF